MFPLIGLGAQELMIILVVALLLFGGSRVAGIGKGAGRAIREFKEETHGLNSGEANQNTEGRTEAPRSHTDDVVDGEIVDTTKKTD